MSREIFIRKKVLDILIKTWYNTRMNEEESSELIHGRPPSKFRSPQGIRYTRSLFRDMQQLLAPNDRACDPLYTLQHPWGSLPCFRLLYVAYGDPTGYQLSQDYLEDFSHWQLLMKSAWFRSAKEIWDVELEAKLAAEAMSSIRLFANGSEDVAPAVQLSAAKYLADKQWKKKDVPRGRPSKAEVDGNLKRESSHAADLAADLDRIRLVKK